MGFEELPLDLKNIISDFAYECKWETVEENLVMCETVKQMHISSVFTREIMWSIKYREYIPCPFRCFEPIQNYSGTWADYIDWCAVTELLWRLERLLKLFMNQLLLYMIFIQIQKQQLFDLKMAGVTPIIAHPERYKQVQDDINIAVEWL